MEQPSSIAIARDRLRQTQPRSLLNLRMLGFAMARAWVYLMFLGTAASSMTWNGQTVPGIAYLGSTVMLCATLLASAVLHERFAALIGKPSFRALGPVLVASGTLALASATLPGAPEVALCLAGALLTGGGSGIIDLGYGELYRNVDPRCTSFEAPLAFFIAAALFPLVLGLPSVLACIVCALLPAVSGWILFVKMKAWSPSREPAVKPFEIHLGSFAWKIGVCACLIGLADGVVRAVFMTSIGASAESFYRFPLLWSSLLTMAIIYGCVLFSRETGLRPVYRSVMLVMAVFFMLLPVFTGYSEIESTIALTGYGTFNVLIWILLADISFTYRLSSHMVFGIGWGMVTLGVLLGSAAGQAVCALAPFQPQTLSLIALLATLAILISYMFVFSESDLIALAKGDEEKADAAEPKRQRFQDRCKEVADEYGLSPKETEIMVLFAKGRSSTRIQEELYLSRGTVTTHLRHIYQKMDVHSKQEFLDVIEGRQG
ncbi:helix-turn-helix transcriptional regulator [Gordonibacter sp. An230]|uniref:LuxR C-terminal-related transcriptional regulator n=1 Tax=Gordonibacter sp. An230 TaxID=1965592 RepID=UPI000B38C635|nr:LuxR C-terminal-related transcriptional regulator [Gordonibacter sp. An230]OUO92146.1 helix-turn-helix transcriptional regulator [Gordonibacter sp. An230]